MSGQGTALQRVTRRQAAHLCTECVPHGDDGLLLDGRVSRLVGEHDGQMGPPVGQLFISTALDTDTHCQNSYWRTRYTPTHAIWSTMSDPGTIGLFESLKWCVACFTVATAGILPDSSWKRVWRGSLAVSWPVNLPTERFASLRLHHMLAAEPLH